MLYDVCCVACTTGYFEFSSVLSFQVFIMVALRFATLMMHVDAREEMFVNLVSDVL